MITFSSDRASGTPKIQWMGGGGVTLKHILNDEV